ncbi:hypothetical protein EJ02DRAFT_507842 [Clathrospora elynae]|uniref:Uncharacterized protein n=1 Tax=Clathrospora elynae TaxID=706981 RepID=A0A6A5T9G5_9PLEO|nr:hypothetical protein EJ02DRAFT_507842 [Clathrospora elynae]
MLVQEIPQTVTETVGRWARRGGEAESGRLRHQNSRAGTMMQFGGAQSVKAAAELANGLAHAGGEAIVGIVNREAGGGSGLGAWGLGLGAWGLELGAWSLGFGAWGLGLEAWGLRLTRAMHHLTWGSMEQDDRLYSTPSSRSTCRKPETQSLLKPS